MTSVHISAGLVLHHMTSEYLSSGLVLQRKEKCTLECTLSSKEEESSYLWPFSSTSFMLFPCLFSLQVDRRILEYIFIHVFNQKLQLTGICNFWGGERVNKQHVSLQEPSSGATYRWWYSYSLVQSSKIAVGRHMQFLRGGKGEY